MYYLATPMYRTDVKHSERDEARLERNLKLTQTLEESGIKIFLPQRDAEQKESIKEVIDQELEAIRNCDGIIVMLSDTRGIYIEAGYAKAFGKKLIGLKVEETREFSSWGYEFFDHIVSDISDVVKIIKAL